MVVALHFHIGTLAELSGQQSSFCHGPLQRSSVSRPGYFRVHLFFVKRIEEERGHSHGSTAFMLRIVATLLGEYLMTCHRIQRHHKHLIDRLQ